MLMHESRLRFSSSDPFAKLFDEQTERNQQDFVVVPVMKAIVLKCSL